MSWWVGQDLNLRSPKASVLQTDPIDQTPAPTQINLKNQKLNLKSILAEKEIYSMAFPYFFRQSEIFA